MIRGAHNGAAAAASPSPKTQPSAVRVSADGDSQNIIVSSVISPESPTESTVFNLSIRDDTGVSPDKDFRQWFYFDAINPPENPTESSSCEFHIHGLERSLVPVGWEGHQTCISRDGGTTWTRIKETHYDKEKGRLTIPVKLNRGETVQLAPFEPYPYKKHQDFIASLQRRSDDEKNVPCTVNTIGSSVEGRPISLVTIGTEGARKRSIYVTAGQHCGETMAQWFAEGFISALLDPNNAYAQELLKDFVIYVVPNMNPDGNFHGNMRATATGLDPNRSWSAESKSPEVACVVKQMEKTGCALHIDGHGDEKAERTFFQPPIKPGEPEILSSVMKTLIREVSTSDGRVDPDYRYPLDEIFDIGQRGKPVNLDEMKAVFAGAAVSYVSKTFNCDATVLEMSFGRGEPGYTAKDCVGLGGHMVRAMSTAAPQLLDSARMKKSVTAAAAASAVTAAPAPAAASVAASSVRAHATGLAAAALTPR